MVLPLLKLGTLAVKTLSKPLASKLKQQAAFHPKFRQLIINFAQVLIFYICIWSHLISSNFFNLYMILITFSVQLVD